MRCRWGKVVDLNFQKVEITSVYLTRSPATRAVWLAAMIFMAVAYTGCSSTNSYVPFSPDLSDYQIASTEIEEPLVDEGPDLDASITPAPLTVEDVDIAEFTDLTLEQTVKTALSNSRVLRDLGGRVLDAPQVVATTYDPAITETDPRFGVEGALSAFDPNFYANGFHQKNDRAVNNAVTAFGTQMLQQDAAFMQYGLDKRAVTGAELGIRQITGYDANNAPGNRFPSAWDTRIEANVRQPLLLGAGVEFNRIAGPQFPPGTGSTATLPRLPYGSRFNGVMLARIDEDVSLADFEESVIKFISNVENAYWDLYFSYRNLHSRIAARDAALETWRRVKALNLAGRVGGEEENEAQAQEQYYRFEEAVQDALSGRLVEGTRDNNGSRGGTFRGLEGIQVAERRMRLLMGLPLSDGTLLRPIDEPPVAEVIFDWETIKSEALARRVELRRQRWQVKRRMLELEATNKFLLPRLDALGTYRFRGFGKDLMGQHEGVNGQFNNAWGNLGSGDYQEWELGMEFAVPLGHRRANAAVKNAELALARDRAILHEQEREVVHDLSNSVGEVKRSQASVKTTFNRRLAAKREFEVLQDKFEKENITDLDRVLDAQRRFAEADTAHYKARVEYALGLKNLFYAEGTLLEHNQIYLSEGPWPQAAYCDAEERSQSRVHNLEDLQKTYSDPVVSRGPYGQVSRFAEVLPEDCEPEISEPVAVPPGPDDSDGVEVWFDEEFDGESEDAVGLFEVN